MRLGYSGTKGKLLKTIFKEFWHYNDIEKEDFGFPLWLYHFFLPIRLGHRETKGKILKTREKGVTERRVRDDPTHLLRRTLFTKRKTFFLAE